MKPFKDLSRRQKNSILILVNALFLGLLVYRSFIQDSPASFYFKVWIYCCPIIISLHLVKTDKPSFLRLRDALLFLLTGGAIGGTVGTVLKGEFLLLDIIWLIVGLVGAFIHYSPSKNDQYTAG